MTEKVILAEDFAAAASAQRTLTGRAAPEEFLYGRNEPAVQHFHQRIAAALAAPEDLASAPPRTVV